MLPPFFFLQFLAYLPQNVFPDFSFPCLSEVSTLHLSYPRSDEEEQDKEESQSNQWKMKLDKAWEKNRTNWMRNIAAQASNE